jgi:hypothetical protein
MKRVKTSRIGCRVLLGFNSIVTAALQDDKLTILHIKRLKSSIRRDRQPDISPFRGSGLPIPEYGLRSLSFSNALIRFRAFCHRPASQHVLPPIIRNFG